MKRQSILVLVMVLLFGLTSISSATTVSFQGLGDLTGGEFNSLAHGISADGSTVVGGSISDMGLVPVFWINGAITPLVEPIVGPVFGASFQASSDGSVVVGLYGGAFRWENEQMADMGDLPGGILSQAYGVSGDGTIAVGYSVLEGGTEAFRWENEQIVGLGYLDDEGFKSRAYDISADGSVIVGYSISPSRYEAFRWENGIMTSLGHLGEGTQYSQAYAVSSDGSVIVGESKVEAFLWEDGIMTGLGHLPGLLPSTALDVSAYGSVVVGFCDRNENALAFIWTEEHGIRNLKDMLITDFGLNLTDWTLRRASGITPDGLTIVGMGINPDGYEEAWIVTIPEPATVFLLGLGVVMLRRKRI
ncbi:PEP-CTERM sorting domain-containing protein [Planctomycetota bacterium]